MINKSLGEFFIHSKCCNAHWEMIYNPNKKEIHLVCAKCGKDSGIKTHFSLPEEQCKCVICDQE